MNPPDIFQVALAAVTRAFPAEDFELYAALPDLPDLVQIRNATLLVATARREDRTDQPVTCFVAGSRRGQARKDGTLYPGWPCEVVE